MDTFINTFLNPKTACWNCCKKQSESFNEEYQLRIQKGKKYCSEIDEKTTLNEDANFTNQEKQHSIYDLAYDASIILPKDAEEYKYKDAIMWDLFVRQNKLCGIGKHGEPLFQTTDNGAQTISIEVSIDLANAISNLGDKAVIGGCIVKTAVSKNRDGNTF